MGDGRGETQELPQMADTGNENSHLPKQTLFQVIGLQIAHHRVENGNDVIADDNNLNENLRSFQLQA